MPPVERPSLAEIEAAHERVGALAGPTPLLPYEASTGQSIWLKLENLQPIGSFKIRGAANAIGCADPDRLAGGVYTASAGNMAQGVAFSARALGIPCRVIVPDSAPAAKVTAIEGLGGTPVPVPFDEWWQVLVENGHPDESGHFVHPVAHRDVVAGNGTIGLEVLSQLPSAERFYIPFGGGGLSCGIAAAVKATHPDARIYAVEVETAAPLTASLAAGRPVDIDRIPSFVDGIGGRGVLEDMWPLVTSLLDGTVVVTLDEVCDSLRSLVSRAHVVAEGAGAAALAGALRADGGSSKAVAVISGGNLDPATLAQVLEGVPGSEVN